MLEVKPREWVEKLHVVVTQDERHDDGDLEHGESVADVAPGGSCGGGQLASGEDLRRTLHRAASGWAVSGQQPGGLPPVLSSSEGVGAPAEAPSRVATAKCPPTRR